MERPTDKGWQIGADQVVFETPYFDLVAHQVTTPAGHAAQYYFMQGRDWIKIVPVTTDGRIVLIDQFRPVSNSMSLEIPGGMTETTDQTPEDAARRELLEETGYTAQSFRYLGWVYNNPAIFSNRSHVYLAIGATRATNQKLDPSEEMSVVLLTRQELMHEIASGRVRHSVVMAALNLWLMDSPA